MIRCMRFPARRWERIVAAPNSASASCAPTLAYTDIRQIIRRSLHEFLNAFQTSLNLIGQCIFDTFLP